MAPPKISENLPMLTKLVRWVQNPGIVIDGPVFRLHHQASSLIIMLGFVFISMENYLDTKAIVCHNAATAYAKQYCWIHGYSYIHPNIQDKAAGCYVDQTYISSVEDSPITTYYMWLPYLLSLLFFLCKLPHSIWKKYFENNMISQILGGRDENWDNVGSPIKHEGGGGDNQGGKKNKNNQQNSSKKETKVSKPLEIARKYIEYRRKFNSYHHTFAFWEIFNIVTTIISIQVTHWLLNRKFWSYGLEVIYYLNHYQGYQEQGEKLHDPMCEVFPTEVGCQLNVGSQPGKIDTNNFLCILGNNMFNQKYFFLLWLWWMALLLISIIGLLYRLMRITFPLFSKMILKRKVHGPSLGGVRMTSGESFVLEMLIDNLTRTPKLIDELVKEVSVRLQEIEYREEFVGCNNFSEDATHDRDEDNAPLISKTNDRRKDSFPPVNHSQSGNLKASNDDAQDTTTSSKRLSLEKPPNYSLIEREDHLKKNNNIQLVEINEITKDKDHNEIVPNVESEKEKTPKLKKKNKKKVEKVPTSSTPFKDETIPLIASPIDSVLPNFNEISEAGDIETDDHVDGFPPNALCKREWL